MIGILYICTGKYDIFWKKFYRSCEKYFLPGHEKRYFVFTDAQDLYGQDNPQITKIYQETLGWPQNTLLRFKIFLSAKALIESCDYLFFFNANIIFLDKITDEILPTDKNEGLLVVTHPGFWDKAKQDYPYDKNPDCCAYIPDGKGVNYFMGGFNGGKTKAYLQLINTLNNNIQQDLKNNIVARWHDESHLNNYMLDRKPVILSPAYGFVEGYNIPFKPKLMVLRKEKFGGHNYLRNLSDKKEKSPVFNLQKVKGSLKAWLKSVLVKKTT